MSELQQSRDRVGPTHGQGSIVAIGALLALLGVVYVYRVAHGLYHPTVDDYTRLVWSREWGHNYWILTPNPYWPPLPNIIHGAVSGYWGTANGWLQTLPSVVALAFCIVLLAWPHRERPEFFNAAGAAALLGFSVIHELAAGHLSEPFFLPALVLALRAFFSCDARPSRRTGLLLLGALVLLTLIRYEGWMIAGVIWMWIWAQRIRRAAPEERISWKANRWFILGGAVLSIFPIAWMIQNDRVMGDFLSFLKVAARENKDGDFVTRLRWAFEWTVLEGPVVVALALGGLAILMRRRDWKPIALFFLLAIPFAATVIGNKIQTVFPERFPIAIDLCACMAAAVLWDEARRKCWLDGRLAGVYLPLALAAAVSFAAAQTTVLATPTAAMRLRDSGREVRAMIDPDARALILLTKEFLNTMEDTMILTGGFETARAIHEDWLWEEPKPLSLESIQKHNFQAVLYRNPAHLQRVAAPLGAEMYLDVDWRARLVLDEDEHAQP